MPRVSARIAHPGLAAIDLPSVITEDLHTERLIIRRGRPEDTRACALALIEADPPWLGANLRFGSKPNGIRSFMRTVALNLERNGRMLVAALKHGEAVASITAPNWDPVTIELGWLEFAGHKNHGYALEAVQTLIDHLFATCQAKRITLRSPGKDEADPKHHADIDTEHACARELGLRLVEDLPDLEKRVSSGFIPISTDSYAITQDEWAARLQTSLPRFLA